MQTCFIVMAGLQSLSSSRIDRHTVPDGYTFGWKSGGSNLPKKQNVNCTYVWDLLQVSDKTFDKIRHQKKGCLFLYFRH